MPADIADNTAQPVEQAESTQAGFPGRGEPAPAAEAEPEIEPGLEVADAERPGTERPGTERAGTERAGTDLPGTDDGPQPEAQPDETAEADPDDVPEPVGLIEMSEPVELAEPVEDAPPRRRGHGLLVGLGFLVAALAIIVGAFAIVSHLTHGFKKPVIVTYKKAAIFSLRTGECLDARGQQAATVVPCAQAHQAEVFATFRLPRSAWPGASAVATAASSGCGSRLTGYLNPQLAISLVTTYVYPDPVAWRSGTRKVICEVRATSGDLTGSVRGASAHEQPR